VSRQEGFTLVELMVALVIGLIVLLAGFTALDRFTATSATITVRTDNTQRARLEMDLIIRELRSQVCVGPGDPSLVAGTPTAVTFVTDLSDGSAPEKRTVSYDATTRRLRELRYLRTGTTTPLTFSTTSVAGPVQSNVDPVDPGGTTPIFRYYAYNTAAPPRPELELPTPLSTPDRGRVARITVAFKVGRPSTDRDRNASATLQDEVLMRTVDPSDLVPLPLCS